MRFLALKNKSVDMGLISIALQQYGFCDIANDESELYELLTSSFSSRDLYKAIFIHPGTEDIIGFKILENIRNIESKQENAIQVIFLCEDSKSIFFMETFSKATESFISKNIIKRDIIEILTSKNIIN